jgi:predicted transglutaminase-like cysteine proteinase
MKLYRGKKRVFSKFFNKMETKNNIVVGYGSAKFCSTAKNEVSVPTSRAYKECSYRFHTIPIDEFRTSKIYHGDSSTILETVKREDTNRVIRCLLWYSSTIGSVNKFVNRDLNAAINILNCLVNKKRPKMLCRSKEKTKIVQKVGKLILC